MIHGVDAWTPIGPFCVDDETADLSEPFLPDETLWELDSDTGERRDARTGNLLIGRQDFPDVFWPDRSITMIKAGGIAELNADRLRRGAKVFELAPDSTLAIRTPFDLMRFHAKMKANAIHHAG